MLVCNTIREVLRLRLMLLSPICLVAGVLAVGQSGPIGETTHKLTYTEDGRLRPMADYREWIYLSSGLDMSYSPRAGAMAGESMFDNVFVNPEAYRFFKQTGTWPDGTILILEVRGAGHNASINKAGSFQSEDLKGVEAHVKDVARGGWAFYGFDGHAPAKMVPKEAICYSCHRDHGAVDTTFVQFYPTLAPLAKQKHTFNADSSDDGIKSTK